eukprot:TRINITY_DN96689_c0_g1_i1.p1 TRINITY_DN96689_c0_g1~~TRINITY_DN96689_c0_g1_i1.p1  ORF type:complete len:557 (-),score=97.65 TRINITY_DN96689_c0_g1_i1:42-1712(-)
MAVQSLAEDEDEDDQHDLPWNKAESRASLRSQQQDAEEVAEKWKRRVSVSGKTESEEGPPPLKMRVKLFMGSLKFEITMGLVIVCNAVNIGWDISARVDNVDVPWTEWVEHTCLALYTVELLLHFYAEGWACLQDNWIRFDTFLVVFGVITQWMVEPAFGTATEDIGPLMVLRTARLLRLARTVRMLIRFKELWMLVQGLLSSANTMLYTLLLLFVILYIFACLGLELVHGHPKLTGPARNEEFALVVEQYFSGLFTAMLSLIRFATFDEAYVIYEPLAKDDPFLLVYFMVLILCVGIVIMNLVTAVVVNAALEQTEQNKDLLQMTQTKKKKKMLKDLRAMFVRLDEDGSGELSRAELLSIGEADKTILRQICGASDPVEMYDALDVDGAGEVSIDDFCEGLWQIAISNTPIEIKSIQLQIKSIRQTLQAQATHERASSKPESSRASQSKGYSQELAFVLGNSSCTRSPDKESNSPREKQNGNGLENSLATLIEEVRDLRSQVSDSRDSQSSLLKEVCALRHEVSELRSCRCCSCGARSESEIQVVPQGDTLTIFI